MLATSTGTLTPARGRADCRSTISRPSGARSAARVGPCECCVPKERKIRLQSRGRIVMYKRLAIATVGLMVLLSTSVPVFAQDVREFFGPPVPLAFDSEGGRHWR